MTILLVAASPIELEAEADAAGLPGPALAAGLSLYHTLTSELGLRALEADKEEPTEWPVHRFILSENHVGGEDPVARLQGLAHARHVSRKLDAGEVAPTTLYADARDGGYRGLLIACPDETRMAQALKAAGA